MFGEFVGLVCKEKNGFRGRYAVCGVYKCVFTGTMII